MEKYLAMIKRENFDSDEKPAIYALPEFHGLWPLFSVMVSACYFRTGRTYNTDNVALLRGENSDYCYKCCVALM